MQYMDASRSLIVLKNADGLNYLRRLPMSKNKPWLKARKRGGDAGKGDRYRPVDREQYEKNYDAIFKALDRINDKFDKALEKLADDENKDTKRD